MSNTSPEAPPKQDTQKSDNQATEPSNGRKHGKTTQHLKNWQWKKGQSGNPKGRPKRTEVLTDLLWAELKRKDKKQGVVKKVLLIRKLVDKAIAGDMRAQQIVIDRLWGKAPDNVQITGQMGNINIQLRELLEIVKDNPEHGRRIADTLRASITDRTGS